MAGPRSALVVEDFGLIAADAQDHLATLGYADIAVIKGVDAALRLLAARRFDFALLSIVTDDGLIAPVAQRCAEQGVPFVLVSDLPDGRDRPAGFSRAPFVTKPYTFADLADALGKLRPPGTAG